MQWVVHLYKLNVHYKICRYFCTYILFLKVSIWKVKVMTARPWFFQSLLVVSGWSFQEWCPKWRRHPLQQYNIELFSIMFIKYSMSYTNLVKISRKNVPAMNYYCFTAKPAIMIFRHFRICWPITKFGLNFHIFLLEI